MCIGNEDWTLWPHSSSLCTFGFNPKADRLFLRVQGLDSPNKLRVFTDKNVEETRGQECLWNAQQGATSFSHGPRKPEARCLPTQSYVDAPLIGKLWE